MNLPSVFHFELAAREGEARGDRVFRKAEQRTGLIASDPAANFNATGRLPGKVPEPHCGGQPAVNLSAASLIFRWRLAALESVQLLGDGGRRYQRSA